MLSKGEQVIPILLLLPDQNRNGSPRRGAASLSPSQAYCHLPAYTCRIEILLRRSNFFSKCKTVLSRRYVSPDLHSAQTGLGISGASAVCGCYSHPLALAVSHCSSESGTACERNRNTSHLPAGKSQSLLPRQELYLPVW